VIGAVFAYKTSDVGGGRHVWDPIQTPEHLQKYLKWLWFGQMFNLYGMALIKLSICAYILKLDFSKSYRIAIWLSLVLHVGINIIFASVILLGECQPISKHWNLNESGTCWGDKPKVINGKRIELLPCPDNMTNQSSRLLRRSNQHSHRPYLHRRTPSLYLASPTTQTHPLGRARRIPPRSHVRHPIPFQTLTPD
jgi:hypothetical protein